MKTAYTGMLDDKDKLGDSTIRPKMEYNGMLIKNFI